MNLDWMDLLTAAATALGVILVMIIAFTISTRLVARRAPSIKHFKRRAKWPFRVLVIMVALNPVIDLLRPRESSSSWWEVGGIAARMLLIVAIGWLATTIVLFVVDAGLRRYRSEQSADRRSRQLRTQTMIIRRLIITVAIVLIIGAALLTLPGARAVGTSVLASAGLVSVVAALAAQTVLGNVFAGIQIAFSDSIRLDDEVIIEGEQGRVQELTLTYVVVLLWDERCLVLPCTYFTTTPFQNLTRNSSDILGTVELDLDWQADTDALRLEFDRALADTDLWDGRDQSFLVTDATNGYVRVRAMVTASDAGRLFRLRAHVRERLVNWVRENEDHGMPRNRLQIVEAGATNGSVPFRSRERQSADSFAS